MNHNLFFMNKAIKQAKNALGSTFMNPAVGCVIVKNQQIIAQAATSPTGRPHAEANAIQQLQDTPEAIHGSDMYITLEPCFNCLSLILQYKIKNIYIADKDLNPKINGKSIEILKNNNINVVYGLLQNKAREIHMPFFKKIIHEIPWVTMKVATSIDGKITYSKEHNKQWITGEHCRNTLVQQLRKEHVAILVGSQTILTDNPRLNYRSKAKNSNLYNPIRIVIDHRARIPKNSHIIQTAQDQDTWILSSNHDYLESFKNLPVRAIYTENNLISTMKILAKLGITSILLEGGKKMITSFLKHDLIDKIVKCIAPKIISDSGESYIGSLKDNLAAEELHLQKVSTNKDKEVILQYKLNTKYNKDLVLIDS